MILSRTFNYIKSNLTHRKLRFDIVSSFLGLFLLAVALIVGYFDHGSRKTSIFFARQLIEQITSTTVERATNYIENARTALTFTNTITNSAVPNFMEDTAFKEGMLKVLCLYPYFTVIQIALVNGSYISMERVQPGAKYITNKEKLLQDNIAYLSQYQNRNSQENLSQEIWTYYDKEGKVISQEVNKFLVYDARTRPWYINTEQKRSFNWSPVYMFSLNNSSGSVAGTTASSPFFERNSNPENMLGVIGVDLSLNDLSLFLKKNLPSPNSLIFIVNEKGQMVASTDPEHLTSVDSQNDNIRNVEEVNNKSLKIAYAHYKAEGQPSFSFSEGGAHYLATFSQLQNENHSQWYVGVIVPEDDFLVESERIKKNIFYMVLISLLIFTALIFLLSKRISLPIITVAEEAQKIQNFDIQENGKLKSSIYEIQIMIKSLEAMKNSLISFNKFVPKSLVKKLLKKGGEIKLGGVKKELTVFFSDIENFTNISEGIPPEKLVSHLSNYLDELSKILTESNGTIDKYIGDSIMAFWGAPLHDKEQTFNACHGALKCQKRLSDLNRQWELDEKPIFVTRMGIHRDEVVVGIIGSQEKMNYTVMGDGVNAASRLEGLNKIYGSLIIVSEQIVDQVENHFLFRPLDFIAVKGKKKPIKIYELMAQNKDDASLLPSKEQKELRDKFCKAFKLYTIQKFSEALNEFEEVAAQFPQDQPSLIFIERCKSFIKTPPPADWDGVTTLTHK